VTLLLFCACSWWLSDCEGSPALADNKGESFADLYGCQPINVCCWCVGLLTQCAAIHTDSIFPV
jgi:hypothetical protein